MCAVLTVTRFTASVRLYLLDVCVEVNSPECTTTCPLAKEKGKDKRMGSIREGKRKENIKEKRGGRKERGGKEKVESKFFHPVAF